MPGTFGSAIGLIIYVALGNSLFLFTLITALIILSGLFLADKASVAFNRPDPPQIVIDEIGGMLISFLGILVYNKFILLAGFVIFRILDIIKPYPANIFHRKRGSAGIMGDDIVAGIYTNLILRFILFFLLK